MTRIAIICIVLFLAVAAYTWFHARPAFPSSGAGTMDGATFFRTNNE